MSKYLHSEEDLEMQHKNWTNTPQKFKDMDMVLSVLPDDVETVLDYGCGSGRYSQRFNDYVGYDNNPIWIPFARKKYPDKRFVLKLGEEKYDLVLCVSVIQYQPDRQVETFAEDLLRRAKKYAIIQTWDADNYPSHTIGGFKGVTVHKRNKNHYLHILSKYGKVERHVLKEDETMVVYLVKIIP